MGNWDVSKPDNDGERELLDRAVKALEAELATKTCNKQIVSKLEDAELARDSEKTCNNKQVSCKLVASEDAISRADAEALFRNARGELHKSAIRNEQNGHPIKDLPTRDLMLLNAEQMIHLLPSVTPKQRTGHWIIHDESITLPTGGTATGGVICSECGYKTHNKGHAIVGCPYNYCPSCGARMVEPQENCDTCKHKDDGWDSEQCDGCCGNHSGFEPQESEEQV